MITHPAPLAGVRGGPVVRIPTRVLIASDSPLAQRDSLTRREVPTVGLRELARNLPLALPPREHHPAVHDQTLDVMARFGVRLSARHVEDDRSAVLVAAAGSAAALTTDVTLTSAAVVNAAVEGDPLPLRLRLVYGLEVAAPPEPALLDTLQRTLERERGSR